MWDGSLNPAVIQAQINLSLAMAAAGSAAATRRPRQSRSALITPATRAGRRPRGEQWRQSTARFRPLAVTLFSRAANSAQAASLVAVTRWQWQR